LTPKLMVQTTDLKRITNHPVHIDIFSIFLSLSANEQ
jgi:hypothetical protein